MPCLGIWREALVVRNKRKTDLSSREKHLLWESCLWKIENVEVRNRMRMQLLFVFQTVEGRSTKEGYRIRKEGGWMVVAGMEMCPGGSWSGVYWTDRGESPDLFPNSESGSPRTLICVCTYLMIQMITALSQLIKCFPASPNPLAHMRDASLFGKLSRL